MERLGDKLLNLLGEVLCSLAMLVFELERRFRRGAE